jgi:ATP-binding cassette subfamily B protein
MSDSKNIEDKRLSTAIKHLISGAWEATAGIRGQVFAFIFLFILAYSLDLLTPWALGYMLGVLVTQGATPEAIYSAHLALGGYILLRLGYYACHHVARYLQQTASFTAKMNVMESLFGTILSFPLSWQVKQHSGEKISRLYRGSGAVDATIGTYIWQFIEGFTKLIFATTAIFLLDFWIALTVVGMGFVTILLIVFFNKRLVSAIRRSNHFFDRLNRILVDYMSHIITVKSFGLEDQGRKYIADKKIDGYRLNRRIVRYGEMKWASVGVGYTIVIGISLFLYFDRHPALSQAFDVAQIYVLLNYLDRIFQAVGSFTAYYSGVLESATAYEDSATFITEARERIVVKPTALDLSNWKKIEFKNIFYSYGEHTIDPLDIPNLELLKGQKIALVGPSGGGKSTFLKSLAGVLLPEKGELIVDGKEPRSIVDIFSNVLILPQEPEIFSETMRFNMSVGTEYSLDDLDFYAKLCKLENVLEKLPERWDAMLAENGLNLSLGERQRVAVARGLLRAGKKEILLLDEPTSSLDPFNEKELFNNLLKHFADRTIITACHRLAIVPLFDKIIWLQNGRIIEQGSFEELINKRGHFYFSWERYQTTVLHD